MHKLFTWCLCLFTFVMAGLYMYETFCKPKPVFCATFEYNAREMIPYLNPAIEPAIAKLIGDAVDDLSNIYGLDRKIVLAVIQRESSFRPYKVSNKNCIGLMMINYKSHCHKERIERRNLSYAELFHCYNNIDLGCEILAENLKLCKGDIGKALQMYVGPKHKTYVADVLSIYWDLEKRFGEGKTLTSSHATE